MRKNTNPPDRVLKNPPGIPEYYAGVWSGSQHNGETRRPINGAARFLCLVASNSYNVRSVNSSGAMNWSTANE